MTETGSRIERPLEIRDYGFGVPGDFYGIPLDAEKGATAWIDHIVTSVRAKRTLGDADPGALDVELVTEQLLDVQRRLSGGEDPSLLAMACIRSESPLSMGALLSVQQLVLEADDDIEAWERMALEYSASTVPGVRSRDLVQWRGSSVAGEFSGCYQKLEFVDLGAQLGVLNERCTYVLFPTGSHEVLQFSFTADDFGFFNDMRAETEEIVRSTWVKTGVA